MAPQTQQAKKSAGKKTAVAKASAAKHQPVEELAPEERERLVAETAYLIAEQRGFQGDQAMADWLQAEAEVDARYAERH